MRRNPLYLSLFSLLIIFSCKEESEVSLPSASLLEQAHDQFVEPGFEKRRFGHEDMMPVLFKHAEAFEMEVLGQSVEGRDIHQLTIGSGPTKVLLWSQMHGDESTATMALFDLFNFLNPKEDDFEEVRGLIKNELTMKFIPMVNPDGAERFIRRNALGIDLNRDAIRTSSVEAELLKNARESFNPDFGFNLHDQSRYYNTQGSRNPATISVLAPAYNEEREINEVRLNAMKVISGMNHVLQQIVPQHVGKYNDTFEPRAFGDNFQKWGTSTILIESGGFPEDTEKQYIRKLNFIAILGALSEIANRNYENYEQEDYFSIPDNESRLMDLLIRNVRVEDQAYTYTTDIGIRRTEITQGKDHYVTGQVSDWGDLSTFFGYVELEAEGMQLVDGEWYEEKVAHMDFNASDAMELLRKGYLWVRTPEEKSGELHNIPMGFLGEGEDKQKGVGFGSKANFFLKKDEQLRYAVVNGYLIDLVEENPEIEFKNRY